MYRRNFRSSRPRTRSFSRFRRPGAGLRYPTPPKRWEVCNLAFTNGTFVDAAQNTFTGVVRLAGVYDGLGDVATAQGRAITNAVRWLEIGGLVLHWKISLGANQYDTAPFPDDYVNRLTHRVLICSDQIDNAGNPNSIPDWFVPGTPLASVSTTTPTANSEDVEYPTRIHHQWARFYNLAAVRLSVAEELSPLPQVQEVTSLQGSKSLRLRLRLDDRQGLFLHFATRILDASTAAPAGIAHELEVVGTMYYRFRF